MARKRNDNELRTIDAALSLDTLISRVMTEYISSDRFQTMVATAVEARITSCTQKAFLQGSPFWVKVCDEIDANLDAKELQPAIEAYVSRQLPLIVEEAAKKMLAVRVRQELEQLRVDGRL